MSFVMLFSSVLNCSRPVVPLSLPPKAHVLYKIRCGTTARMFSTVPLIIRKQLEDNTGQLTNDQGSEYLNDIL